MKGKKKLKKGIRQAIWIAMGLMGIFFVLSMVTYERPVVVEDIEPETNPYSDISDAVIQYRPLVEKYAEQFGVTNYVDVMLAMMMQESGGRGNDPMQASESYCGQIGCIQNPEDSIKQGVYYFSKTLNDAEGDLELAIQSYNFGRGFIDYVQETSGSYSEEIAIDFSQEMYENAPDKSIYSCLREEAKQYDACYGDIYYVKSVMAYRDVLAVE